MAENRTIRRLLVANRGEIARRVIRTCHALGIETVAIFSDPDRSAPFVDEATYAVSLGGTTSAESYLDSALVLDAARRSGADAIHPGYGFLSENAEFAQAVADAGLVWVGPTPDSMRAMALKVEAKRIAATAGVPLVPGAELDTDVSDTDLVAVAAGVGYPVLVKASAGGGGKGMRVVRTPDALVEAVAGARREAAASFGDPTVFLERYVERSRHVEVQVFGDTHGDVVHLFERECSIQRRHQKIVEESPSPGATSETLERMYAAALALARAIGYVGAGTVEFLVSGDGAAQEFFFLEMNTRLQVEHPVTETVTGLDLVAWQLFVAQGRPLPLGQGEIEQSGHAIEARLYAEDPSRDFLPSTGTLSEFGDWIVLDDEVRIDSGVDTGSVVSPFYDPMLAKVIARGDDRAEAAGRLAAALTVLRIDGVTTNADSLVEILRSPAFAAGDTTTAFLDEHPELLTPRVPAEVRRRHLVTCAVALLAPEGINGIPAEPTRGWRNVAGVPEVVSVRYRDGADDVVTTLARSWGREGAAYWIALDTDGPVTAAQTIATDPRFERVSARLESEQGWPMPEVRPARLEVDGVRRSVECGVGADSVIVESDGVRARYDVVTPWAGSGHGDASGGPSTPVPGTVTHVAVAVGDAVEAGAALVVLEAMKMEHTIRAGEDGVVAEIHVSVGQSVDAHTVVVTLEVPS
jgi:acetyl/propionyl-CoA carboxylase alpha subunit